MSMTYFTPFLVCLFVDLEQVNASLEHSLETCARLLFMLLQDFLASVRLHRVHNFSCQRVQYIICST